MAGMLQEEHPFMWMYELSSNVFSLHLLLSSFLHQIQCGLFLWFNHGRCIGKISKKLEKYQKKCKRVSKIACFLGPNYVRLNTGWKTTTY